MSEILKKNFVTVVPGEGIPGATGTEITPDPNPLLSARAETINFTANGATTTLAVNQQSQVMIPQIIISKDAAASDIAFQPWVTDFDPTGGDFGCPWQRMSLYLVRTSERYYIQVFCAILHNLIVENDPVIMIQGMSSTGTPEWTDYAELTNMGGTSDFWWGKTTEVPSGGATRLKITLGLGRGDVGIENNQYLYQWYITATNRAPS